VRGVRQALETRLEAAGVGSLKAARELLTERTANEERRTQYAAQIQNDLRDLQSARELAEKLQREREAIRQVLADSGMDQPPTVDEAKARRDQASAALLEADGRVRVAGAALAAATSAVTALEREAGIRESRIAALREELERAEHELAEQRSRRPDDELEAALVAAETTGVSLREALATVELEFASLPDNAAALAEAEHEVAGLSRELDAARLEAAGIRALLEDAGASGLHGQLVEAEQRLTAATEELQSFSRRAAAARLLFETLKARRDQARESYAGPLKECLEGLGRRIYNESFAVELSDDLRIVRRSLDGFTLDLAQISVGAREQLSVLTRLACAALVSKDGGAPLVLDDILGWADPKRLEALGPVLADAAGDSQVLLFTCSPGRFASVRPARVITLPSGEQEDRPAAGDAPGALELPAVQPPPANVAPPPALARPPQGAFDLFDPAPTHRVN
jgi:hypothetical protein